MGWSWGCGGNGGDIVFGCFRILKRGCVFWDSFVIGGGFCFKEFGGVVLGVIERYLLVFVLLLLLSLEFVLEGERDINSFCFKVFLIEVKDLGMFLVEMLDWGELYLMNGLRLVCWGWSVFEGVLGMEGVKFVKILEKLLRFVGLLLFGVYVREDVWSLEKLLSLGVVVWLDGEFWVGVDEVLVFGEWCCSGGIEIFLFMVWLCCGEKYRKVVIYWYVCGEWVLIDFWLVVVKSWGWGGVSLMRLL